MKNPMDSDSLITVILAWFIFSAATLFGGAVFSITWLTYVGAIAFIGLCCFMVAIMIGTMLGDWWSGR